MLQIVKQLTKEHRKMCEFQMFVIFQDLILSLNLIPVFILITVKLISFPS